MKRSFKLARSAFLGTLFCAATLPTPGAEPLLLAHFKFNGNGDDAVGNSPPMNLAGVSFAEGTVQFPATNNFTASAQITGLDFNSFAVAFDFKPSTLSQSHGHLLCGGLNSRWIVWSSDANGRLSLALNDGSLDYVFSNVLQTNRWHTLVCSVDVLAQRIATMLDGEFLPEITLPPFNFDPGPPPADAEKTFSFWNFGNGARLCGSADNLRVYDRALMDGEMEMLHAVRLVYQPSQHDVILHWSVDFTGYALEAASVLSTNWAPVPAPPMVIGTQKVVIQSTGSGTRFYRLRRF